MTECQYHSPVKQHLLAVLEPEVDRVGEGLHVALQLDVGAERCAEQLVGGLDVRRDCRKKPTANETKATSALLGKDDRNGN